MTRPHPAALSALRFSRSELPFLRHYPRQPAYATWAQGPSRLAGAFRPSTPAKPSEVAAESQQSESLTAVSAHLQVSSGNYVRSAKRKR